MKSMRLLLLAMSVGLVAQPGFAFQQTTSEAPAQQGGSQASQPASKPGSRLEMSNSGVTIGKSNGTEVKIPGIGTVGILPKLDFGLELLYGANEAKGMPEEPADNSDVQIRGTIKHRF